MTELYERKGFAIGYDYKKRRFEAFKNKQFVCGASTQIEIEEAVDKQYKKLFKRIPVIISGYHDAKEETITSASHHGKEVEVWTVDEEKGASKHDLPSGVYQVTQANLAIVVHIKKRRKQMEALEDEIERLQGTFTDPVTAENIDVLGGIKEPNA